MNAPPTSPLPEKPIAPPKPSWKDLVHQRKEEKSEKVLAEERLQAQMEEERWRGVPEWKRKVLQAKVRLQMLDYGRIEMSVLRVKKIACFPLRTPQEAKEREAQAPLLAKQKELAEKQARLAAMPEWKRQLAEKKSSNL